MRRRAERGRDLLVVDTSGLLAALDEDDPLHDAASQVIASEPGPFYMSPFVLQEIDYFVSDRIGYEPALRILEDVRTGAYRLEPFDATDVGEAASVMRRYADLSIGLADASIVVIAARHGTERILTLDRRHFRAIRPLTGGAFMLLPEDA